MKKCPFCAEEIQDAAIKCRFCQSFLSSAPVADPAVAPVQPAPAPVAPAAPAPAPQAAPALSPAVATAPAPAPFAGGKAPEPAPDGLPERIYLYAGSPSWRAFFREYFLIVLGTIVVPILAYIVTGWFDAGTFVKFLAIIIPIALGVIAFFAVNLYRKSKVFRVSTTNIETEMGILSKKIDVLELWRCRDVRYKQHLSDRILGIAHIEIFTADVTTPTLEIVGLPASRRLFEKVRDSIEIQRQSRNVYGMIQ